MHEGKSFDYLKCHKCGQSRGHPEKFRDLQLGVRGMTSLQQSFEAYTCGEEVRPLTAEGEGRVLGQGWH